MDSRSRNVIVASFNCRSIKRSINRVRLLCKSADIILLQETWLLPHDLNFVHEIDKDFECFAKSAVDTSVGILRGRPYGGLAILWRKSLLNNVSIVDITNDRLAAIKVCLSDRKFLVLNVYMPNDTTDKKNIPEFTDCLANMCAIVDDSELECAYLLGDYNAKPGKPFWEEMMLFCDDHDLLCADLDLLGLNSGTFTCQSDAHGTTGWLDHCLVTKAARDTIVSVKVDYDTCWSDHLPLIVECDIQVVINKCAVIDDSNRHNNMKSITWGNRNNNQIDMYRKYCSENFAELKYSSHCSNCDNFNCIEHLYRVDEFYDKIILVLQNASITSSVCDRAVQKKGRQVPGWNYHVGEVHRAARYHYKCWLLGGKPTTGDLYENMRTSRNNFKNKLKWCQNNEDKIKMNILAVHRANKNFTKFWSATKKSNYKTKAPTNVESPKTS